MKAVELELVSADDRIVVINTGNGLKDVASAMTPVKLVGTEPYNVPPSLKAVKKIVKIPNQETTKAITESLNPQDLPAFPGKM